MQKSLIFKDNKDKSFVYRWINKLNNKEYLGSTANAKRRLLKYYDLSSLKLANMPIYKAILKHGHSNFIFEIIEYCEPDKVLEREQYYLDNFDFDYNILEKADSILGYKHTEVDRQKMSFVFSDERREMIGNLNRGKKLSHPPVRVGETIDKLRERALNRPPMSDETKKKCIKHTRPVVLYNLNGTVYGEYSTILDAARSINCGEKTIRRALKTEKGLVKRQ